MPTMFQLDIDVPDTVDTSETLIRKGLASLRHTPAGEHQDHAKHHRDHYCTRDRQACSACHSHNSAPNSDARDDSKLILILHRSLYELTLLFFEIVMPILRGFDR